MLHKPGIIALMVEPVTEVSWVKSPPLCRRISTGFTVLYGAGMETNGIDQDSRACRALVRAALRAAVERSSGPFVSAAFFAAAERDAAERLRAAALACCDSAL